MWETIKQSIAENDFETARKLLQNVTAEYKNDIELILLECHVYYALEEYDRLLQSLYRGFRISPCHYELYYLYALYLARINPNQAYLAFRYALHYCQDDQDMDIIRSALQGLSAASTIQVRKTAIVIVSFNSCYLLQKTIDSIRNTLPADTYRMIVVDNGSDADVIDYLQNQPDLETIYHTENTGFSHACNQGCALALDEDIFLLNNDTRLSANTLFWLQMGLYETNRIGATGSLSNYAGNQQQLDISFSTPEDYVNYGTEHNILIPDPYEERVRLSGFAMLIRHGLWQLVGGMNELFSPGYFEDDDLSMKIKKEGYQLLLCHNSFLYHAGSQSFSHRADLEDLLSTNHQKFIETYGFDILQHAYAEKYMLDQISFKPENSFNLVFLGSGLGATTALIKKEFPHCNLISIEPDSSLYEISACDPTVFPSVEALCDRLTQPIFHVLCIDWNRPQQFIPEDLSRLEKFCLPGFQKICTKPDEKPSKSNSLSTQEAYAESHFKDVKLIIWDLDDTFWKGTLSEGCITLIPEHIKLLHDLVDCGIMNSISSKNDKAPVMAQLEEAHIDSLFVFPQINWDSKGYQIRQKLAHMFLRPENVLFIDDNPHNLEDALYQNDGLMVAGPSILPKLIDYIEKRPKKDTGHSRLSHYHLLEQKDSDMEKDNNKTAFLHQCHIQVSIEKKCLDEIDRIVELVARTNQLNYTKLREDKESLLQRCFQNRYDLGYVKASDRYGDYGIVGFYCMDTQTDTLIHFAFSCRVIGMGVEQYVYLKLGCPHIQIKEPVAVELTNNNTVSWISEGKSSSNASTPETGFQNRHSKPRILLKGPCDLSAISAYLIGGDVSCEFNYVNPGNFITAGQNHSVHLKESLMCQPKQLEQILSEVPFLDYGDFHTNLFTTSYDVICYSLLPDCHSGLYQKKDGSFRIAFGSKNFDLTNPDYWDGYINGTLPNHAFPFTKEILEAFRRDWDFAGQITAREIVENIAWMKTQIPGHPAIILLLGSSIPCEKENAEFADHASFHAEINSLVKEVFANDTQIHIIDPSDFIHSQEDYMECINHYSRNVYYDLATEIVKIINAAI